MVNSIQAEESIIGSIIINNNCLEDIVSIIKPEMFSTKNTKDLYTICLELYSDNMVIDAISIVSKINQKKLNIQENYIYECISSVISTSNIKTHASILLENFLLRSSISVAKQIEEDINTSSKNAIDIIEEVENKLHTLTQFKKPTKIINSSNMMETANELLGKKSIIEPIFTGGFPTFDSKLVVGFPIGDISLIAACPSNGKSSFRSQIELELLKENYGVITVATEQRKPVELNRKIASLSQLEFLNLIRKNLSDTDREFAFEKYKWLEEHNYHLIVDRSLSLISMRKQLEKIVAKHKIHFVSIDLFDRLQEIRSPEFKAQNISKWLAFVNEIVEDLNIHICLLNQIRRDTQKKSNPRPKKWEIKDSGAYEEFARLIFLLFREKLYVKQIENDVIEVNIAKQDNGAAGDGVNVYFDFEPKTFKITESRNYDPIICDEGETF